MRKRIFQRAAIVTVILMMAGCAQKKPATPPLQPAGGNPGPASTEPTTEPTTEPSPTTAPMMEAPGATQADQTTQPATMPVAVEPATEPAAAPTVTIPVTQPAEAATEPASQPVASTEPATEPTTQASGPPPLHPAPPTTNPLELQGDATLAEWFCSLAQNAIPLKIASNDLWEPTWKRIAAMLEAAEKLNPTEARFSRLLTDAELRLHNTDAALAALNATRKADPGDQFAQAQFLDLTVGNMETVDAKVAYLKTVMGWKGSPSVPETIRSHAGVMCAQLLIDRGETETAKKVLAEALRLNPASVEGLRLRYAMLPGNTSNFERAEALMALLKANPDQAQYAGELADRIAGDGLVEESLPWYQEALMLGLHEGKPDVNLAVRTASEMFIAGQSSDAAALVNELTRVDPRNSLSWFLKLTITHSTGNKDEFNKVLGQARNALSNRLIEIVNQIDAGNGPQATTRPITADGPYSLPDLNVAVLQINQGNSPLKNDFVTAAFHLATLEIYFAQQPDAAANLIQALKLVLPADSPDLTRLAGWSDLVAGRNDDARTKLSTIAAHDPLAQLGLVKLTAMDPAQRQMAQSMGRKLITDYPTGVVAAMLWEGMRDLRVAIIPSREGDALKQELEQFPKDWLKILDQPQNFYQIHTEPVTVGREFGQPMLARVRIQNLSNVDLTIGPDGVLKRDLWFNAEVKGVANQQLYGVAFDRIAGPLVLHGRGSTSQVIRLDQGTLKAYLASNPIVAMQVTGSVMTNPTAGAAGQLISSPGGYTVRFTKVFSRSAAPLGGAGPQMVLKAITDGTPDQKMAAINLLSAYAQIIRAQKEVPDALKQVAANLTEAVEKARLSPVPAVSAWAGYASFTLADAAGREGIVRDLAADPDWRHRQVAVALLGGMPHDLQRELGQQLTVDPEPSVRDLATAWMEYGTIAATLPPATEPAAPAGPAAVAP